MPSSHTVQQGESIVQLSERYGLFARTIWNDPGNAALRAKRRDMNVLAPGDVVVIPDVRAKQMSASADQRHVFKRRGIPALVRIQVVDNGYARANQSYVLTVDGVQYTGTSDENGIVEQFVSAQSRVAQLVIGPSGYTLDFDIGHMDPADSWAGVEKRLLSLGLLRAPADSAESAEAVDAVRAFQMSQGLPATGTLDDATRTRLEDLHDRGVGALPEGGA